MRRPPWRIPPAQDLHWIVTPEPSDFAAALAVRAPVLQLSLFIVLSGDVIRLDPLAPGSASRWPARQRPSFFDRGHATLDR